MKSFQAELHRSDPMYSAAASTSPSSTERGAEAARLVVIDDDRMFRDLDVQIDGNLARFARLGTVFTLANLFPTVRRLLALGAQLPVRKR